MKTIKSTAIMLVLLVSFTCNCKDRDMEAPEMTLYDKPLSTIQQYVYGKWKCYRTYGGVVGVSYPQNTFIEIRDNQYIMESPEGIHTFAYEWKKKTINPVGESDGSHETYVMWDNERDNGIFYFHSIKSDTLSVGGLLGYPPFFYIFVRRK